MASSPNNSSFIPKRGTTKRTRKVRNGNVYILTIISYVAIFSALLAAGSIFLYQGYVQKQLQTEITSINAEVRGFKEADMQKVQEFDVRLRQANSRLDNAVSVTRILSALEVSVIDTVRLASLEIKRKMDNNFIVEAEVETDTFDSTIYQQGIFARGEGIEIVEIDDVSLTEVTTSESGGELRQSVTFVTKLAVPLEAVLYQVPTTIVDQSPVLPISTVSETGDSLELTETANVNDVNQNDL